MIHHSFPVQLYVRYAFHDPDHISLFLLTLLTLSWWHLITGSHHVWLWPPQMTKNAKNPSQCHNAS